MRIKIKDATPMLSQIFVTSDRYTEDETTDSGLIIGYKGDMKPYQKVFRIGPYTKLVKVGDIVKINFSRYIKYKYTDDDLRSEMPTKNEKIEKFVYVELDGKKYLHVDESDVVMIVKEGDYEEVEDSVKPQIVTLENHGLIL